MNITILWRLSTTLVDGQTSWVYCITLVQYLCISCYVFSNKLVLSYLSLCLLLQWWPRCDWSWWPRLRGASSQTVTRPSCWQCADNPTWSLTARLSRFHACCRSSFRLHNRHSQLLGGSPVESLQSHYTHTMSHWSNGLPICFPSWGTRDPQGATYKKLGFSCWRCLATISIFKKSSINGITLTHMVVSYCIMAIYVPGKSFVVV
jgi:hypothetical protein